MLHSFLLKDCKFVSNLKGMKRTIIKIDENKCTGCGLCVSGCHEGALQLIDGKAVMISELYCDGLGACIGECPENAITLEEREAEAYSETETMKRLVLKGENVIVAHLQHLLDCKQKELFDEGICFLQENKIPVPAIFAKAQTPPTAPVHSGCPGSRAMSFDKVSSNTVQEQESELRQWPVQLHLLSPQAPYLQGADLLIAADCTAFSVGNFHSKFLKGKRLAIACPKLDQGREIYIEKIRSMIDDSHINSITVMIMEVPCCGGLLHIVKTAVESASRKVPVKLIVVGLEGNVLKEEWI